MLKYILIFIIIYTKLNAEVFIINNSTSKFNVKIYDEFVFFDYFGTGDFIYNDELLPNDAAFIRINNKYCRVVVYDSAHYSFKDMNFNLDTLVLNVDESKKVSIKYPKSDYTNIKNYVFALMWDYFRFDNIVKTKRFSSQINS